MIPAMNRFAALLFAVLLGSVTLVAQRPASGPASTPAISQSKTTSQASVYVIPAPTGPDCPVSMHAQQQRRTGGRILTTSKGLPPRPSGIEQRIRLILESASDSARVAGAKVTVRGTNGKGRTTQTLITQDQDALSDAMKTLDITFDSDGGQAASADLVLPGFTSVQSIRLDSLAYSDGSTWSPSKGKGCRIAPDPMMLVGDR
jgi:hypothetical protein